MSSLCIIIPCYNEAKRLPVGEFEEYLNNEHTANFYFVNDGSKDDTLFILDNLKHKYPNKISIITLPKNMGKAEAIREGINEVLISENIYDYIGFFDADLSTPLSEIVNFEKYITENPFHTAFLGSRIKRLGGNIKRNILRHYLGRVFATFASITLKIGVYDTQCGAKIFTTSLAEKIFSSPFHSRWLFDVELIFRIMDIYGKEETLNKIIEIPLTNWQEKGASKISPFYIFKVPFELFIIKKLYSKSIK